MILTKIEHDVLSQIPIGAERKTTIAKISKATGRLERNIYEAINGLRMKGVPVCAIRQGLPGERGYYIATNEQERAAGLAGYRSQISEMSNLIEHIENADLENWMC